MEHKSLIMQKIACLLGGFLCISAVEANPVLGNIGAGNVSIQQSGNTMNINQSSSQAILNWQSFNIGQQEATHFIQPAGGIALNRISPTAGASQIYGELTATGQIILINPAGIYFGPSSVVNVGGLIATTANITDANFLNGNYQFSNVGPGSIINAGELIAADHGLIALVGSNVQNNGLIKANLGQVVLASGNAFTVNFGDDLVNFAFSGNSDKSGSVSNTGTLIANGGQILVTAQAAQGVLDNIINMQGVAEAKSVYQQNGEIVISGDPNGGVVDIAGTLNASGKHTGQTGGTVDVTGYDILLDSPTLINVSGDAGGGKINIGGNFHGAGPLPNSNAIIMMPGATLLANAITKGNGGNVALWSKNMTEAYGSINASGGSQGGNGGFVETSGSYLDVNGISVNTSALNGTAGTWLLDPTTITISSNPDSNLVNNAFPPLTNWEPTDPLPTSNLNTGTLEGDLNFGNVNVQTTNNGGSGTGDIIVENPVVWTSLNNGLTLTSIHDIIINATVNGPGGLTLDAVGTVTINGQASVNVSTTKGSNILISNGETVAGAITGTGANNTLTDLNPNAVWTFTGPNSGTLNGATFANFQNIVGSLSGTSTINVAGLGSNINVLPNFNLFSGKITVGANTIFFTNINKLIGSGGSDTIFLPLNIPLSLVTYKGAFSGFIDDPLVFVGFHVVGSSPNASPVIQQGQVPQVEIVPPEALLPTPSIVYNDDYPSYIENITISLGCAVR